MKLSILFLNDVHGYLFEHPELFHKGGEEYTKTVGGYARLAGLINQVKADNPNTLVFDGGDTFHGTLPVVESKGEILLPILCKMQIDAMVGHWDFAYGPKHLERLDEQLPYPVLAINVYNKKDGSLYFPPYEMREVGGVKISIIGICATIVDKTMPEGFSDGIELTDGIDELPGYIKEVKDNGADLVILLSHNGFPQDCELLRNVNGVDVCLSAHTHNRMYEAEKVNDTLIIQCGCHGSFIGQLDLTIENSEIKDYKYELKIVDENFPTDAEVQHLVDEALQPYREYFDTRVGGTPLTLHRYNTLNSTMDNFMLAALLDATDAEVAFSNGWRYGAPIPKGRISRMQLFNIIPHNPPVSVVELTGKEIRSMIESNLEHTFSAEPFEQMGGYVKRCLGLTVYFRIENPKGKRIMELYVGDEMFDPDKAYKAAFVTEQGVPKKLGKNRKNLDLSAVDAMENFLRKGIPDIEMLKTKTFKTL